jgi:hypothetical protein
LKDSVKPEVVKEEVGEESIMQETIGGKVDLKDFLFLQV